MQLVIRAIGLMREQDMRIFREICGLLLLAGIVVGFGQFLPGLAVLFEDYLVGFVLVAIAIPVFRRIYKSHMANVAKLPLDERKKKERESQKWWKETSEATFSPSQPLDLRNVTNDDSLIK
ncbi:hypothetical protein Tel_11515 [Candidatus Tenderia electrophaga]|uniref:Uncharacterized protein n=1 Tax=Candidatus Tenderia electrophaga TaxID=1748243 RepID=A0A0S2TF19_9GAMM|nr:hypothetical protein Tel_11515 [Candidatus Tenderia electrophaga]